MHSMYDKVARTRQKARQLGIFGTEGVKSVVHYRGPWNRAEKPSLVSEEKGTSLALMCAQDRLLTGPHT